MSEPRSDPAAGRRPDDLLSVAELAEALGTSQTYIWLFAKRYNLPRYRLPARGKTTLFRWDDAWRAYNTPQPVEARRRRRDEGKAAA